MHFKPRKFSEAEWAEILAAQLGMSTQIEEGHLHFHVKMRLN